MVNFIKVILIIINMADGFSLLIQNMQNLGFFQFLFPFLLALAIIYGLLAWALKEQLPKSARGVIALIFAFFVMLYSSWNTMVVQFFTQISGTWLIVASGILFVVILLAMTGFNVSDLMADSKSKWITVLLVVFIGAVIFMGAGGGLFLALPISSEFWTIIFFVIILAIVVFWFGQEGGGAAAPTKEKT